MSVVYEHEVPGLRSRLVKGYDEVGWSIVWHVATINAPRLQAYMDRLNAVGAV